MLCAKNWVFFIAGWTHSEETLVVDLERAAKTSCYRLVNKLMFYNALRRRYSDKLPAIAFGPLEDTGEKMRQALNEFFEKAIWASGDYETPGWLSITRLRWRLVVGRRESRATCGVLLNQAAHCTERIAMQAMEQAARPLGFL